MPVDDASSHVDDFEVHRSQRENCDTDERAASTITFRGCHRTVGERARGTTNRVMVRGATTHSGATREPTDVEDLALSHGVVDDLGQFDDDLEVYRLQRENTNERAASTVTFRGSHHALPP